MHELQMKAAQHNYTSQFKPAMHYNSISTQFESRNNKNRGYDMPLSGITEKRHVVLTSNI